MSGNKSKWVATAVAGIVLAAGGTFAVVQTSSAGIEHEQSPQPASPWQAVANPVTKGDLTAITALADNDVYAVGYRTLTLTDVEAVLLHWDGVAWTQHSTLPRNSFPQGLSVRSATDIWAVGAGSAHWDGTAWTNIPLGAPPGPPPPGTPPGPPPPRIVPDVVATAPDGSAWLAGRQAPGSIKDGVPAVAAFDGTKWVQQTLPADLGKGELTGISLVSKTDIWVAGSTFAATAADAAKPLLLHWDGTAWSKVDAPTVPGNPTWLTGVTAFSANDVWAVGATYGPQGDLPYALHYDGRKWTVTVAPPVPDGRLRAVGRTASGQIWALGGKGAATVALRWTGRAWQQEPAPDLVLRAFTTVPGSGSLWAVGVEKDQDLIPRIVKLR